MKQVYIATIMTRGLRYKEAVFESLDDAEKFLVKSATGLNIYSVSLDDLLDSVSDGDGIEVMLREADFVEKKKGVGYG
jgi:hypothetical protein